MIRISFLPCNHINELGGGHKFKIFNVNLDIRKYSFSQRVIDTWNNLPESVVESSSINQFKSNNDHWKTKEIKFQPDCYTCTYSAHTLRNQIPITRMDQRSESL